MKKVSMILSCRVLEVTSVGIRVSDCIMVLSLSLLGLSFAMLCLFVSKCMSHDASYLTNGYLDTIIDWIPGMKDIRRRDLPSFIRTTDPNDFMIKFSLAEVSRAPKASAIILNTFDDLEHDVLNALSSFYTIGPLHLRLNQIPQQNLLSIGSNLWKEEPECIQWLSSKEPKSVVCINFGSITVITPHQLLEFAWGLAHSKQTFLWIIRPDLIKGDTAILPPQFLEITKERGLLASWCSQEQVLNHPSTGGFLTHSGWNSTIESVCGGVPMVCWPFFAGQQTNCWFAANEWGIGREIDSNVKRDEVEKLVRELMEGEKGEEMRNKVMEWKAKAVKASGPNGSPFSGQIVSLEESKFFFIPTQMTPLERPLLKYSKYPQS